MVLVPELVNLCDRPWQSTYSGTPVACYGGLIGKKAPLPKWHCALRNYTIVSNCECYVYADIGDKGIIVASTV